LPQYKTLQTDRQTDDGQTTDRRDTVPKARPIVRSAKNRHSVIHDLYAELEGWINEKRWEILGCAVYEPTSSSEIIHLVHTYNLQK